MRKIIPILFLLAIALPATAENVYVNQIFKERIALPTSAFFVSSVTPEFTVTTLMNGAVISSVTSSNLAFTLEGNASYGALVHYLSYTPTAEGLLEFSFKGIDLVNGGILEWTDRYIVQQPYSVIGGWIANATTEINANETKIDTMQGNITTLITDTGTTIPANIITARNQIGNWVKNATDLVVVNAAKIDAASAVGVLTRMDTGTTIPALIHSATAGLHILDATMLFSNTDMDTNDVWGAGASAIIRNCSASAGGMADYSSILINQFSDGSYEVSCYDYRIEGTNTVRKEYINRAYSWAEVLVIIRRATPDQLESHYGL